MFLKVTFVLLLQDTSVVIIKRDDMLLNLHFDLLIIKHFVHVFITCVLSVCICIFSYYVNFSHYSQIVNINWWCIDWSKLPTNYHWKCSILLLVAFQYCLSICSSFIFSIMVKLVNMEHNNVQHRVSLIDCLSANQGAINYTKTIKE